MTYNKKNKAKRDKKQAVQKSTEEQPSAAYESSQQPQFFSPSQFHLLLLVGYALSRLWACFDEDYRLQWRNAATALAIVFVTGCTLWYQEALLATYLALLVFCPMSTTALLLCYTRTTTDRHHILILLLLGWVVWSGRAAGWPPALATTTGRSLQTLACLTVALGSLTLAYQGIVAATTTMDDAAVDAATVDSDDDTLLTWLAAQNHATIALSAAFAWYALPQRHQRSWLRALVLVWTLSLYSANKEDDGSLATTDTTTRLTLTMAAAALVGAMAPGNTTTKGHKAE